MQMNQLHETVISISVNMCTCKMQLKQYMLLLETYIQQLNVA